MTPQMCGTYPMIHALSCKNGAPGFSTIDARQAIQNADHRDVHHTRHCLLRARRKMDCSASA